MTRPADSFLHQQASASSLGLARVLVFGVWFIKLAVDPIQRLAELPASAFDPPGVLRVLPSRFWDFALGSPVLLALKVGLLIALAVVLLGVTHSRVLLGLTVGGLVVYQGIVRGFSGHINHAELGLLYVSLLFVFFPVFDGLTLRTLRSAGRKIAATDRGPDDRAPYVAAMLTACILLSLTYFFVGAVRVWKGIDLFTTPALRDYVIEHALQGGRFDGNTIVPAAIPAVTMRLPPWVFESAFIVATALELSAPLAVFSQRLRPAIVLGLLCFHVLVWASMDVPFPENMILLTLFSGTWFHRIAARLDRSTSDSGVVPAPS